MARKLAPWWRHCQWAVIADTPQGPQKIYCARRKQDAKADAKAWTAKMGQRTRVIPGEGHRSRRDR